VPYYLFEGNKLLVRKNKFQWLNSDVILLQMLTSVLLTINHHFTVTGKGGGNADVDDVTVKFTCDGFFSPGVCGKTVNTKFFRTNSC